MIGEGEGNTRLVPSISYLCCGTTIRDRLCCVIASRVCVELLLCRMLNQILLLWAKPLERYNSHLHGASWIREAKTSLHLPGAWLPEIVINSKLIIIFYSHVRF